jgi:hypothetical protein
MCAPILDAIEHWLWTSGRLVENPGYAKPGHGYAKAGHDYAKAGHGYVRAGHALIRDRSAADDHEGGV